VAAPSLHLLLAAVQLARARHHLLLAKNLVVREPSCGCSGSAKVGVDQSPPPSHCQARFQGEKVEPGRCFHRGHASDRHRSVSVSIQMATRGYGGHRSQFRLAVWLCNQLTAGAFGCLRCMFVVHLPCRPLFGHTPDRLENSHRRAGLHACSPFHLHPTTTNTRKRMRTPK
jgi:hypothetical protein